jgi:hypothetical protein
MKIQLPTKLQLAQADNRLIIYFQFAYMRQQVFGITGCNCVECRKDRLTKYAILFN